MERTLHDHAHHEDTFIDPVLREHRPDLAAAVVGDHERLDGTFAAIVEHRPHRRRRRAPASAAAWPSSPTSSCRRSPAPTSPTRPVEELEISPALERAVGPDAMVAIHMAIIGSIPPDEMAQTLTMMLPAMNVDDRTELLAGMQASAPPEAFAAVVGLAGSVLTAADFGAVARRLELSVPARR